MSAQQPVTGLSPAMARAEFLRVFERTARHHGRWQVFHDFVTLAASELDMARVCTAENRARMAALCGTYSPAEQAALQQLFCLMTDALSGGFQDFLGSVFMELELGNDRGGQFFTPWSVSRMMAGLLVPGLKETLAREPFVSVTEPACGAGGLMIAYAAALAEAGFNPATQLLVSCTDIDAVAADMAFIQLSLPGMAARVDTGNTLAGSVTRTRYTPVWYLEGWDERLKTRNMLQAFRALLA